MCDPFPPLAHLFSSLVTVFSLFVGLQKVLSMPFMLASFWDVWSLRAQRVVRVVQIVCLGNQLLIIFVVSVNCCIVCCVVLSCVVYDNLNNSSIKARNKRIEYALSFT